MGKSVLGALACFCFSLALLGAGPPLPPANPLDGGTIAVRGHYQAGGLFCVALKADQIKQAAKYPHKMIHGVKLVLLPEQKVLASYSDGTVAGTEGAMVSASGPIGDTEANLCTKEYTATGVGRIAVVVLTEEGEQVLTEGRVNLTDFSFSIGLNPDPNLPPLYVCCSCSGCRNCIDWCKTFTCICPGCTVFCNGR